MAICIDHSDAPSVLTCFRAQTVGDREPLVAPVSKASDRSFI